MKGQMDRLEFVSTALFFKYSNETDAESSVFKVDSYSLSDTSMFPDCGTNQNRTEPPSWPPSCPVAVNLGGVHIELNLKGEIV